MVSKKYNAATTEIKAGCLQAFRMKGLKELCTTFSQALLVLSQISRLIMRC